MQDKITINPFDPDSIDEAIKKLEKRKERIHKCAEKLIQRLTDLGVEKAQELVPVDTGTARSSIIGYLDEAEGVGIISAGGYCKYIEFGTGVKGRDSSHPSEEYKAIMNWAYNSGATIFTTKDGREGWYYPADDGTWRFTEGMPSRPFMYETAQYLRKEAQKIAACMLCMATACEKKDKKENDTSAVQATETDCTAAERVTTEPEGEITISEMIDQRIKEEGKITLYRMRIAESNTPVEITEDLKVKIISYDGDKLTGYKNPNDFLMETRLGDIIHNKVDYSTYNIGAYGGNWKRHRYVSGGDEKYVEEEGYVQREITTDDSGNNAQLETLYSYSKGTLYSRDAGSKEWNQTEKEDSLDIVSFGTFERIKLDGKTYMTFCVRNNLDLIEYDIIPDNKFTENKTVVYDTPGTEETTVNTVDYLKEYQAVPKEELEQMIVFPGSKKAESSQAAD